jgi:hypothetical protein
VRLHAESVEVTRMVSRHADALAQRLEARGYPGVVVQVRGAAPATAAGREERPAQEGHDGGQGQRRGRR